MLLAQIFPGSERAVTSQDKGECQKMTRFMTWAQGRVEMSSLAPTARKAISTRKEATSFWTLTRS